MSWAVFEDGATSGLRKAQLKKCLNSISTTSLTVAVATVDAAHLQAGDYRRVVRRCLRLLSIDSSNEKARDVTGTARASGDGRLETKTPDRPTGDRA